MEKQAVPFSLRFEYVWHDSGRTLAKQDNKWYYIDGRGERISEIVLPDGTEWAELYGDRIVYGCGDKYASPCGMLNAADCYDLGKASECPCPGLVDRNGRQVTPMSECGVEPVETDDDLIIVRAPSRADPEYSDCCLIHIGIDGSLTEIIPLRYTIPIVDNQGPEWIVAAVREFVQTFVFNGGLGPDFDGEFIFPILQFKIDRMADSSRPYLMHPYSVQLPLQPLFHYRIGNYHLAFLDLDKLFLDQRPLYNADIGRRAELVFLQNLLRGKLTVNPVYDSSQEIHLIGSKALGLFLEQRRVVRLSVCFSNSGVFWSIIS